MSETPKCPYCGKEMTYQFDSSLMTNKEKIIYRGYFCCPDCHSRAPVVSELSELETIEEVEDEARLMAMERVEQENRVLTLEEVVRSDAMWYEHSTMQGTKLVILGYAQNEPGFTKLIGYLGYGFYRRNDAYNDFWRCWLRKPTPKEMEATPWES